MYVLSNAALRQAELVQADRWSHGPLELVFLDHRRTRGDDKVEMAVWNWNASYRWGTVRPGDAIRTLCALCPSLKRSTNPNLFVVPRVDGAYTQLHVMLASVVPNSLLERFSIRKRLADFHLGNYGFDDDGIPNRRYATAAEAAFADYLWPRLLKGRASRLDFSARSSIRLLADDTSYWMSRLYRIAVKRAESFPEVSDDDDWEPLSLLEEKFSRSLPQLSPNSYRVTRPLMGGPLWCMDDQEDCDEVLNEAVDGGGVMKSLDPIVELLLSRGAHEEFSDRYSWVKDTFERDFYHRRAKLKVSMVETTDDAPCWAGQDPEGYERVLFRNLMSFLDLRQRHLFIALRHGKTVSEISTERGLRSHAAVSRQVAALRRKVRRLLQD